MIKPVQHYQTSDNRTFASKTDATRHEFSLELRGLFQTNAPKQAAFTPSDVSQVLIKCAPEIQNVIRKYSVALNRLEKAA